MSRLPEPGKDSGQWGHILNDYLNQSLDASGALKPNTVGAAQLKPNSVESTALADASVTTAKLAPNTISAAGLSGSYTDLTNKPTIPTTAAQVGAEPVGLSSATQTALKSTYIQLWKPSTIYAVSDIVTSPNGDVVTANVAHTSAAVFTTDAAKWTLPASLTSKIDKSEALGTFATLTSIGVLVALGDSIAAAVGATSAATAYPAQVGVILKTLGINVSVVPAGVSGETTSQMLSRLPGLLTANNPSIVTIQASINDARLDRSISSEQTSQNIRQMVALCRKRGTAVYVISSAPIDPIWFNNTTAYSLVSAQKAVTTNARVKQLCTELGVPYIDVFTEMLGRVNVLSDGVHPTDIGHVVWARTIAASIADRSLRTTKKTLFSDGFDRPDDATTLSTPWVANTGVWGVTSGTAYSVTQTDGQIASVDAGFPDVVVRVKQPAGTSTPVPISVIARMTDSNNLYLADTNPAAGRVTLYKRVAGTFTTLTNPAVAPAGLTDELIFVADKTHLMVYLNGSPVIALTDSTFTTGNFVGIRQAGANACRWEEFIATA